MKKLALIVCCFSFVFLALSARADVMDPTMSMGDPNCHASPVQTTNVSGPFFVSPVGGGGVFAFCNKSGVLWSTFDVVVPVAPGIDQNSVACHVTGSPAPFGPCTVSLIGSFVDIFFSANGTSCSGNACGIPNNFYLLVDLNNPCPPETECVPSGTWPDSTVLTFDPNGHAGDAIAFAPVPEPASLLLLSTGLLAVWQFRRRRR